MSHWRNGRTVLLALGTLLLTNAAAPTRAQVPTVPCRAVEHEGGRYSICEADLRRHAIRLFWQKPDGQPYAYLGALPAAEPRAAPARPGRLLFAMNAGMFHADYRPVGLYVESGRELAKVSTKSGPGNFHLKPNGIFFVGANGAGVLETQAFLKTRPAADLATQSGPMLVINGRLHPRFSRDGESRKMRNGVGVRDANTVVFAISEDGVSFGEFGRLFRDKLKCANALFLDGGSAPALYAPLLQRGGNLLPLGPMVAVFER
jgi:uncharacterized protein YigE (DUF2233 family)